MMKSKSRAIKRTARVPDKHNGLIVLVLASLALLALAATGDIVLAVTIGEVGEKVTESMGGLSRAVTSGSFVAGLGFAAGAGFKFHAHRQNPQQTKLAEPIVMAAVAALLLFLPTFIETGGDTLWDGPKANVVEGFESF